MNSGIQKKHGKDCLVFHKKKLELAARERWQILAAILQGGQVSETRQSIVSVRRFQTFSFLNAQKQDDQSLIDKDQGTWYKYTCPDFPELCIKIRHLCDTLSPEALLGFNNTGNVCVWPSEEVMTYYCLRQLSDFRDTCVIELGGGMTCLSAVALASMSEASSVVMTDGNETSVSNLQKIIQENDFGETAVHSRLLRWGPECVDADLHEAFDFVLCADCVFFDEGREDLVNTIFSLLKAGGVGLVFAPSRSGTLDKFCDLAKSAFIIDRIENYDYRVWNSHLKLLGCNKAYTEDLHYPCLVKLHKPTSQSGIDSRDTTPESR